MSNDSIDVSIFGTGNWGLTLADIASRSGSRVMLYCRRPEVLESLLRSRRHPEFLPDLSLNSSVAATTDIETAALASRYWIVVPPSQHLRGLATKLAPWVRPDVHILSATKGLEAHTHYTMAQVLETEWLHQGTQPLPEIGVLSGPNLAYELSHRLPGATAVSCARPTFDAWAERIGRANLRLYYQPDRMGTELGGALKNVLAIAVGIAQQTGLGESAKAALITRGLHEMGRLAVQMGANLTTLAGLSGLGDMVATASSPHSRNLWCGRELGRGRSLDSIVSGTKMVVEGVPTTYVAQDLGRQFGLPMPITDAVANVFSGVTISDALAQLMARAFVEESDR